MRDNHPDVVQELEAENRLFEVAKSVDEDAWDYRELLDKQYAEQNPRPRVSFEKAAAWEFTRQFYTDGAVMRERVLIPRTSP